MTNKPKWCRDLQDNEIDLAFRAFNARERERITAWRIGRFSEKPTLTRGQKYLTIFGAFCLAIGILWVVLFRPLIDLAERIGGR